MLMSNPNNKASADASASKNNASTLSRDTIFKEGEVAMIQEGAIMAKVQIIQAEHPLYVIQDSEENYMKIDIRQRPMFVPIESMEAITGWMGVIRSPRFPLPQNKWETLKILETIEKKSHH